MTPNGQSNGAANGSTTAPDSGAVGEKELATLRPPFEHRKSIFGVPRSHVDPNKPNPYGQQNNLHRFHYTFFAPEMAKLRKTYLITVGGATVMIILLIWAALPLYWGSYWLEFSSAPNLEAWIVNRDAPDGVIGQFITQAFINSSMGIGDPFPGYNLGWRVMDPAVIGDDDQLSNAIVNNAAWAAVVISENATANLVNARANGDSSYDPTKALSWYFAEARNELVTDSLVWQLVVYVLTTATAQLNIELSGQYLGQIQGNTTALSLLARAPQTITSPVLYTQVNLRPFTAPTAIAVELVGSIYLVIISFIWSMAHAQARMMVAPHLRTRSYLRMRFIVPLIFYFPLSLAYAMISLPFKLPFDGRYTYAGGWFLFWCFCYISVSALGMAIEAMITLLTPRFAAVFLVPWIIANVSVATVPFELQASFYRYGYAMPVYNLSQAVRTILFNTRNTLGLNAGVIIAWVLVSLVTMPTFTLIMRRLEMTKARAEVAKGATDVDAGYEGGGTITEDNTR